MTGARIEKARNRSRKLATRKPLQCVQFSQHSAALALLITPLLISPSRARPRSLTAATATSPFTSSTISLNLASNLDLNSRSAKTLSLPRYSSETPVTAARRTDASLSDSAHPRYLRWASAR